MIIRPIRDLSGNRLLSYDSSIYQQLLGTGIYIYMSVYVRDGYTFQLFLRTMFKHCKNYKWNTFITYIYVRNNVLDKYENNLLHVNTKPWYETDDKVVLKETKKNMVTYI